MLPETNRDVLPARKGLAALRGRRPYISRSVRAVKWLSACLIVLTCVTGALVLTPGTSSAKAQQHYSAVFVDESSLPVTGKAEIQVDANGVGHLVIHVSGLMPGATYPAHIHEGSSIDNPGAILFGFPDLVANPAGKATLVATIPGADTLDLGNRTIGIHTADLTRIAKGEIN